jgi:hypothetical protein
VYRLDVLKIGLSVSFGAVPSHTYQFGAYIAKKAFIPAIVLVQIVAKTPPLFAAGKYPPAHETIDPTGKSVPYRSVTPLFPNLVTEA